MLLHISEPYLWLPVEKENPEVKLHLYLHHLCCRSYIVLFHIFNRLIMFV